MGFLGSFVAPKARLYEPQKCSKDTIYSSCLWQHNKPNFMFYKWWFLLVTNIFFFFWVPPTPYPFLFFLLTHLKKQYWFLKLIDLSLNAFILKYEISIIYLSFSSWLPIFAFPIFWLFFLSSKVSKMKFNQKSLIYKKYNIVRHWFLSKN